MADLYFAGLLSIWHEMPEFTIRTRAATVAIAGGTTGFRLSCTLMRGLDACSSEELSFGARAVLKCGPVRRFGVLDDGPELI